MSSFIGKFNHTLDLKGRFNLPAKLRRAVSTDSNEKFRIIRGFDSCLFIYPQDEWKKYEEKLRSLSTNKERNRRFLRMIAQYASEDQMDKQGRITIPLELLEIAKIKRDVLILGVFDHIQLWDPKVYEEVMSRSDESYEDLAEDIMFDE
ncbi:MAG: division/cell wall cluster transcriptional repressor MraZ [bacterium]|nr:division/cell wall cluster transcriptional repressor MraZ [bacterium]